MRDTTVVPRVIGRTERDAVARVTSQGFRPTIIRRHSASQAGVVFQQTPKPGVRAAARSTMLLLVSMGPKG